MPTHDDVQPDDTTYLAEDDAEIYALAYRRNEQIEKGWVTPISHAEFRYLTGGVE